MTDEVQKQNQEEKKDQAKSTNPYLIPGAIIVAGALIAFGLYSGGGSTNKQPATGNVEIKEEVLPISEKDHVLGSRKADVFLIEYSDYRCGYCGLFHDTIVQLLDEYDGKIAWVYRHTPYQPGGKEAAIASECIAEQLGEDAFWDYTSKALSNQKLLSPQWSSDTAVELGANKEEYEACVASGRYNDVISSHTLNSQALGGQGTPFNVLLTREGGVIKFSGAQPIDNVKVFIDRALKTLE